MAKKKSKKTQAQAQAQKQAEWASPPQTPKAAPEESVPGVPASLPLSPETAPTDSIPDDNALSLDSPTEPKTDDAPVADSAPEPGSQELVAEEPSVPDQEGTSELKDEGTTTEDPEFDVSAWTSDEPATETQPESVDEPKSEEVVQEPVQETQGEQLPETTSEKAPTSDSAPPVEDDWGSFAGLSNKKKKKGKKGKKEVEAEQAKIEEAKIEEPAVTVEPPIVVDPESPALVQDPEPSVVIEAPEPPTAEVEPTKVEEPAVDDWTPPTKSSKKKGKKGKKEPQIEPAKVEESTPIVDAPDSQVPEAPEPPAIEAPEPPVIEAPEPPVIEAPEPPAVEAPEPPVVEAPEPPAIEAPELPVLEAPEPPAIEAPEPPVVEAPEPPVVEAPEPPVVEAPEPPVVEAPEPPVVEAPEPPVVEAPEPPVVEAPEPPVVEVSEPPVTEAPVQKKKGKKGKKVKVEEIPVVIEAPEPPPIVESADVPAIQAPEPSVTEALEPSENIAVAEAETEQLSEGVRETEESIPEPLDIKEVPPEPPKVEETPPEPAKTEESAIEDWAPPAKSSKKKGKKAKKSKDLSDTASPVEASDPPHPELIEAVSAPTPEVSPSAQQPSQSEPLLETQPEAPAESNPVSTQPTEAPDAELTTRQVSSLASDPEKQPTISEAPPSMPEEVVASQRRVPSPPAVTATSSPLPKFSPTAPSPPEAKSPSPPPKPALPLTTPRSTSSIASSAPETAPTSPRSTATERPRVAPAPSKLDSVNQAIEDDRPPAPTPPVTRARPRRAPVYDDDDEDDSAIIQPRLRGDTLSRDSSRGSYPPAHSRPLFASRVPPPDHYSNPPPPPAPPQYHHPRHHYPPAAPPYYDSSHSPGHAPSHSMSQGSGYPDYSPYGPPSHGSSPHGYQESWSHVPPNYGYNGHSPPQRHDPLRSRGYPSGLPAIDNGSAIDDGSGDAFSRIAHAIPDLHALLASYKETHGQLAVREDLLRRASAEHQDKLRAKDDEILAMRDRVATMERKHSTEASRLRLEVGNMEEQVKDLKDRLVETEKFRVEAGQLKVALDATMKSWEGKYKELEEAHTTLQKTSSEEIAKTRVEFEEWKTTSTTKNDAEKIALAIQFDKKLKEADVAAENLRQEASAAHVKEKDDLRSEHQRQQREREESFDRLRTELEQKLGSSQLDCEQALKRERETMEVWAKERATLVQAHREDIESLRKSWEEQRSLLEGQHKKIKDESDKAWLDLHSEANKKAEENKALAEQLLKDKEELLKHYNELKLEHEKEKQIIKSVATNLESEKSRLEKLMESFGDIAEIKSKGDTYYSVSFTQLQKQILDLAATHFMHLPVLPPPEELQQIPAHIPSFLADTPSSRQLRTAYVAHTVSKLVTYRVFGPFLFSLGRRYDKADSLFLSMSNHIRDKSTRKEAIWRQQTLLAAFTSSGAKQRINTAAGTVVEEIVNAIKHFADPKEEEGIKIAVKRIVKLAAETWRFARLEREMIAATMPAIDDNDHDFTGADFWTSYRPEGTPIASLVGTEMPLDEKPKLLLRIFPVIYREPKHENFRDESENEKADEGCIYHHGLALYDDAEPVVQRKEELQAAGLPPTNAASPTAADFPPPLLPAPRTLLPPTPDMEKASARSESSVRSESPLLPSTAPSEPYRVPIRPSSPSSIKSGKTSIRSRTPPPVPPKRTSIRSRSSLSVKTDARSVRSLPPPPPPPKPNTSEAPSSPQPTISEVPSSPKPEVPHVPYTRPPPGSIDFDTPREGLPLPESTESILGAHSASLLVPAATFDDASASAPPIPEATEVDASGPPEDEAKASASDEQATLPAPTESAIIPPFDPSQSNLPTPPHSRAPTPADHPVDSPLFAAMDEIDALSSHRSRRTSSSRRSARSKPSQEELHQDDSISMKKSRTRSRHKHEDEDEDRPENSRRASSYSTRSSGETASLRSDKTDNTERPSSGRNSRYLCESRSAAIKGLYPNSPLAGQSPQVSRANSLRSSRRKSGSAGGEGVAGTWDTTTAGPATEGGEGPKE